MAKPMLVYWRSVVSSAFIKSLDTIGQTIGTLVFGVFGLFIGFTAIWYRKGLVAMRADLTTTIFEVFSVAVMAWIPFFMWGLIRTPYLLYQEQKQAAEDSGKKEKLALEKVKEYETPKIELSWHPTESPYRWWDERQNIPSVYFGFGVKNISGVTIDRVKIELQKIDPRATLDTYTIFPSTPT